MDADKRTLKKNKLLLQWKSEDKNRDLYTIGKMWGANFPDAILKRSLMEKVSNIC